MAYRSLYRTYRPQDFNQVAGQKYIVKTLKNAIDLDKTAHAYLFTGPRGTGKTSIAKIMAKAINCTGDNKPCNQCPSCLAALDNSHPDIIEIDAASNNGVDEIRELIDKVKYAPLMGKKKVYIVDEVHMLTPGAFNAFLKTLEEPPEHVIFILATTEPHKVIATIMSRCQRFDFAKVGTTDIINRLAFILDQEQIKYSPEVLALIASLSDGGMRDALTITDQVIAFAGDSLKVSDVEEAYGLLPLEKKIDFLNHLAQGDLKTVLDSIEQYDQKGIDLNRFVLELIAFIKDLAVARLAPDTGALHLSNKQIAQLQEHLSLDQALMIIDILINLPRHTNARSALDLAVVKIISQLSNQGSVTPTPVTKAEKKVEVKAQPAPVPVREEKREVKPVVPPPPVVDLPEFEFSRQDLINVLVQADKERKEEISALWSQIGTRYLNDPLNAAPALLLVDGQIFAATKEALIISYRRLPQTKMARKKETMPAVINFLKLLTGYQLTVFPISFDEREELKKEFLTLRAQGNLPAPQPILTFTPEEAATSTAEPETVAQMFGSFFKEE